MINLPLQLTPSELLCRDELPPFIDELLRSSRSRREEGEFPEAERCASDALESTQEPGANASRAVALIHRADVYRDTSRLGPALADSRRAYRIFQNQLSRCQRHNRAVAAYALGLTHHWIGEKTKALQWYQDSSDFLEKVKHKWIDVRALAEVDACARLQRWMEILSQRLVSVLTGAQADPSVWVPVILAEEEGTVVERLRIDRYDIGRELAVSISPFSVHSLEAEGRISLTPDFECYAREIPSEECESLGADEGDCALIVQRQAADEEGPGVLETDDGPLFVFFERDDVGNVHFTRPGVPEMDGELVSARFDRDDEGNIHFSRRGVKVIGLSVGYVTALLRPAPPPEQQPVPPPPETPSEQELYDRLVQMAGDTDTADRLIEHERERAPDANRREHIDTAIFRLVHDKE